MFINCKPRIMTIIFFHYALNNEQVNIFTFKPQHVTTEKSNCLKSRRHKALQNPEVKSIFKQNHSAMISVWLHLPFCVYLEWNPGLTKNELVSLQMASRRPFPHFCLSYWNLLASKQDRLRESALCLTYAQRWMLSWKRGGKKRRFRMSLARLK